MTETDPRDVEVVRFLVERRPDATVEQLRDTMELMGLPADSASVEAAVERAGYEVLFRADGTSLLRPRDGAAPAAPAPAPAEPSVAAPGPAAATPSARPPHPSNLAGAVAIAVVVLLVAILAGVAFTAGSDDDDPDTASGLPTTTLPVGGGQVSSPTRPRIAPEGPGSDPGLAGEGVVTDAFDREGDGMGELPGVGAWTAVRGEWALDGGTAVVSGGDAAGLNLATVDVGGSDVRAQVTLTTDQEGAALAFRVVDDENYWLVASAPAFGTVALVHIVDGKATYLGNSGLVKGGAGLVIGVNAEGSTIELLVNGAVASTAEDPAPAGTAIGLGTAVEASDATFDDLTFLVP